MKKYFVCLVILCLSGFSTLNAQSPTFKWVTGIDTFNQIGIYGTKGVPAITNLPGARENSVTWVDGNNNLWMFGGHGYSTTGTQGYLNDLWKYDISTNIWTWISGSNINNQHGVYGTITIPSSNNYPGARQNAYTWKDANGDLWLFGGQGYAATGALSYLNDLWKYNISTGQWTWMSGANTGGQASVYGTLGTTSYTVVPGARFGGVTWIDANNNLWLFGGQQFTTAAERVNDLWRYNISVGQWTWMSGANVADQNGVYGTKGVMSAGNTPGARQACVAWKDNNGDFWLFGGYGFPKNGAHSYLNDLWKYNVVSMQWTWMSGTDTVNQPANYGTKGMASSSNIPGARQMSISWTDVTGDFWMFGAWGYIGPPFGRINDLWRYSTSNNQWTWMAGSNVTNQPGIYGTLGTASTTNIPGARRMSVSWKDATGKFWLFGGNGYDKRDSLGLLSDLWQIDVNAAVGISNNHLQQEEFSDYPVPFNDKLTVEFYDSKNHHVQILDLTGKVIYDGEVFGIKTFDLTELSDGVYFLKTENTTRKIIKN